MKNLKLLKVVIVLLCLVVLSAFNGNNVNAKLKIKGIPVKTKVVTVKKKSRQYQYFILLDFGGNEYEFVGHGGGTSGSVNQIYKACINGLAYTGGTCSGSFTISGGGMTISNLYFTVPGFPQQGPYNGGAEWSSSVITLNCGGGGIQ